MEGGFFYYLETNLKRVCVRDGRGNPFCFYLQKDCSKQPGDAQAAQRPISQLLQMHTLNDIHQQFASFFNDENVKPFAYLVSKKLAEGHICVNLDDEDLVQENLPASYTDLKKAQQKLPKSALVCSSIEENKPFVLQDRRFYLYRYFNYESKILARIQQFVFADKKEKPLRTKELLAKSDLVRSLFPSTSGVTNWQLAAAVVAYLNSFAIITGGPGTGKTTTVAKILALLFSNNSNLKVALAAPTGKAAARMGESLKNARLDTSPGIQQKFAQLQPLTLHRLLGYIPKSPYFKHHAQNVLPYDVVIIDESSMIDVALFAKLMDAIGENTKLIMLGDKNQLASVEAGSLFGDLCMAQAQLNVFDETHLQLINGFIKDESAKIPALAKPLNHPLAQKIVELLYSHRFSDEAGIGKFSKAIIQNNVTAIEQFLNGDGGAEVLIDSEYQATVLQDFAMGYKAYIQEKDISKALKLLNNLRVLCAIREGEQGLYYTNKKIEQILVAAKLINTNSEFYENRPVIMNSNNYELGLFNGDIGIVRPDENGQLRVYFEDAEGKLKAVLPGLLNAVETVFAMTIHKSQGSEFDEVLIILPQTETLQLLTRELLYTGLTRAKKKVLLQASTNSILKAASLQVKRASGIINRFLSN